MTTPAMIVAVFSIVLAIVCLVAVAALARELGVLLSRVGPARALATDSAGLDVGTAVEPLTLRTVRDGTIDIVPTKSSRHLLMFISATCPICSELKSSILPLVR